MIEELVAEERGEEREESRERREEKEERRKKRGHLNYLLTSKIDYENL